MEIRERALAVYVDGNGRCPFERWLRGLKDKVGKRKILVLLARVRIGQFGDWKSVGGGIKELRISYGPGYRIYFGMDEGNLVVLLAGGDKSSQARDIRLAQEYWHGYKKEKRSKECRL